MPRPPLYEKVGEARFRTLMETLTVPQIAQLLCTHHHKDELRAKCASCRRAIYRSIKTLREKDQTAKSLSPIDNFNLIPEIQKLREFMADLRTAKEQIRHIERCWLMIRESGRKSLLQKQRPALWDKEVIDYIIARLVKKKVALYNWKQALRRLFECLGRFDLMKYKKLKARRRDMQSPKGKKRIKTYVTPEEFNQMLGACDTDRERLKLKVHVSLKCREGGEKHHRETGASFCNLLWERVLWEDAYYGAPRTTIAVYETKTGGGTLWTHCPLNLYWRKLPDDFKAYWESQGCPKEGYVWGEETYGDYRRLFKKIRQRTGLDVRPHDMRNTGATWLHSMGADNLAIGQYSPGQDAIGFGGVGWENAEIFYQRYGRLTPKAVAKLHKFVHEEVGFNGE